METSLYIANQKIQFVCGNTRKDAIEIKAFGSVDLPEGTIINGVITNEKEFIEAIEKIKVVHPDSMAKPVRISIGTSQALTKARSVPKLPEYKLLEWMKGEFTDNDLTEEEYLYDYAILQSNKEEDRALLCALKKSMLDNYVEIFSTTDVGISCIDIGLSSQMKLMHELEATEGKTFIVLTVDGNVLDAYLYVDGVFSMSNRMRLLSEHGSHEMAEEIGRAASTLIQFNIAERNEKQIEFMYMCGFSYEEKFIKDYVAVTYDLPLREIKEDASMVEAMDSEFVLDDYLYAVGNLIKE